MVRITSWRLTVSWAEALYLQPKVLLPLVPRILHKYFYLILSLSFCPKHAFKIV